MFTDRHEAGRVLAQRMNAYKGKDKTIILGLARGGVVVASDLAKELHLPLNVVVPRKIGAPGNPEFAIGAILENGEGVFSQAVIKMLGVSPDYLAKEIEKEKARAHQRLALYRQATPLPDMKGYTVILVDDGIATGSTMLAAIKAMRKEQVAHVVVAVPVAATDSLRLVEDVADEVFCLHDNEHFMSVSLYYDNFGQTEDAEVIQLLKEGQPKETSHGAS